MSVPSSPRNLEKESTRCIDDVLRNHENGGFVLLESRDRVYSGVKQDVTTLEDSVLGWIIRVMPSLDDELVKYLQEHKNVRKYSLDESIDFRNSNHVYVCVHNGFLTKLTDKQSAYLIRHLRF